MIPTRLPTRSAGREIPDSASEKMTSGGIWKVTMTAKDLYGGLEARKVAP